MTIRILRKSVKKVFFGRNRKLFIAVSAAMAVSCGSPARAATLETSFNFGGTFYSGTLKEYLTPLAGAHLGYAANALWSKVLSWHHHFDLGFLVMGTKFAGGDGMYNGISGVYSNGFQISLSKKIVIPYLEFGPALGIFAMYIMGGDSLLSNNQTALKYGYYIATGFDKLKDKGRGGGGWGISVTYFHFLQSAALYEFPSGPIGAKGVKVDIKFLFSSK